jgi:hypothetical protein
MAEWLPQNNTLKLLENTGAFFRGVITPGVSLF